MGMNATDANGIMIRVTKEDISSIIKKQTKKIHIR